jgi:hypothetical protein
MEDRAREGASDAGLVSGEDHLGLTRLLTEIAWLIDHGRADRVHELFVDGGQMRLGPTAVLQGRDAIKEWGRLRPAVATRHVYTNQRFTRVDHDTAEGTTTVTVYMDSGNAPGTTVALMVGEETGRFVRTDHGWRFSLRQSDIVFSRPAG